MSLAFGDFEISPETYELRRAGQPVVGAGAARTLTRVRYTRPIPVTSS